MDSGARKPKTHRPMWPEYIPRAYKSKDLMLLEGNSIYDETGHLHIRGEPDALLDWIVSNNVAIFTGSLVDSLSLPLLFELAYCPQAKVLASRDEKPTGVRIATNRGTRWICDSNSWSIQEPYPGSLKDLRRLFEYYGVGFRPSPSSLGLALMRDTWKRYRLRWHTAPNTACETFIRDNAVGGIVQTPGMGKMYDELLMLDMSSAWISQYVIHPTGTPVAFKGSVHPNRFFEYFAECEVFVPYPLPLGPFPIRVSRKGKKDEKRKVVYPTEPGYYKNVFLWKHQVDDCYRAGCHVIIKRGYGWENFTTDNHYWAEEAYQFRKSAPDRFIRLNSKRVNVSAVGRHFSPRERFFIVGDDRVLAEDKPLVTKSRDSINLYLHKEVDNNTAFMVHWYAYTVSLCNHHVYQFALPFAKEGRLVSIDYDSILIVEKNERQHYIARKDFEALDLPPGTWLWMLLHNVKVVNHRSFISDEITKLPGVAQKESKHERVSQ